MSISEYTDFSLKAECCGCSACEQACPVKCITMEKDGEGFFYPSKDPGRCLECDKCEDVCPIKNVLNNNSFRQKVYAVWANDIMVRKNASSGGLFETLASRVLEEGGHVFGAAFDEHLKLKHISVDNVNDLKKLCKSKYLQSNINNSYVGVRELLAAGKKVMFAGTPCQVAALKRYLGQEHNNLITLDFICHGVPSQDMFDRCIAHEEKKCGGSIKKFSFRVKDGRVKHIHGYSYELEKNGVYRTKKGMYYEFPFYFGFKKYLFFRPSCYSCRYSTPNRCSDITLADFWGIEEFLKDADFAKGVSMIVINTRSGEKLFEQVKKRLTYNKFDMNIAAKCNHCLTKATVLPKTRESAFRDLDQIPFEAFVAKYLIPKKPAIYKIFYLLPAVLRKQLVRTFSGALSYE